MVLNPKITIEVAYATREQQRIVAIEVDANCMIKNAIEQSGILNIFPEIDLTKQAVGIFGKKKNLNDTLQQNDRIEIYRPLIIDPKDARKKRVALKPKRKYKKRGFLK